MSTGGRFGRPWRRRSVFGATVIVALVVVSVLTVGAASGRTVAQHDSGDRVAASSASFFPSLGGLSQTLAPITGCGADGTIADASGFEDADGNLKIDKAGCMDWNGFTPTWTGTAPFQTGVGSTGAFTFAGATDAVNTTSDSIYAGGVKQDTVCPGTVTGKANDKADLAAIYISGERIGDQVYLFLAWERQLDTTVNSDVFVSFEFNQSKVSCGAGSPFVQRTVGDVLFDYNFQSGNSTITAEQWDGTTWQPLATPPFEASVNQGTVTDTIRPDGPVDLTTFEFGEAGINLTGLNLSGNGGKACESFGSVLGGSRTSKRGDTAQLKEFVGPAPLDVSNCVQPTATTTLKNAAGNSTIANNSSVAFGSSVYDTVTLGNLVGGEIPTGHVQYTFFANGNCSDAGTSAGLVALNADGTVPKSNTEGPLATGSYSFHAQYIAGTDPHYSDSDVSACEPFTVLKKSPTIATLLSESTGNVGDSVHDSATISGATSDAGGTVKYAWYSSLADCNAGTFATPGGTGLGSKTVTGGVVPDSDPTGPINAAGTYYFRAFYSGDNNNNAASSACTDEALVINAPAIQILKKADASSVSAGDPVGFTITVWNSGAGDAAGVKLNDTLPTNAGLSWTIAAQGAGWGGSCAIAAGVLHCGGANGVTVPHNTTQAASTFTVHVTSPTTKDTAGACPGSGVVDNTGNVTTTNDGNPSSEATVCVNPASIKIAKTADKALVNVGDPIGFTLTVFNAGAGDAHGVKLNDTLPTNAGLSWTIASQGAGWNGSCAIAAGVLTCGGANGVTVPHNTTQAASTFTVHITSPTTGATAGACPGSGVVDNTGHVTTTNDGNPSSEDTVCVNPASIKIVKTADKAQVNVGDPIGFTLTVYNAGAGDANGVKLNDTLPTNAGLSWTIASQGAGWNGSCAIAAGVLTCGGANGVTVPHNTTQAASTFTVHITSPTTGATGGDCPETGVVDNTGNVTTTNDGSDQSSASTCVQAVVDLSVMKSGSPATQTLGDGNITWTMVVTNHGPSTATGVVVADPMPAGNTFVSATTTQGTCTGGAILNCTIGTMAAGASVTITLVTTPSTVGQQTNTVNVVGDRPETNTANNTATATVQTHQITPPPPV